MLAAESSQARVDPRSVEVIHEFLMKDDEIR
jgi:hypothetical protein